MKVAGGQTGIMPEEVLGKGKEYLDEQLDRLKVTVREYPSESLLAALGVGLLLGFLVRRL